MSGRSVWAFTMAHLSARPYRSPAHILSTTCNTDLGIGEEGSTVHTKRPLSQPTTTTEPDNGLKWKKVECYWSYVICI